MAAAIVVADRQHLLPALADERVDQRRLADSRRPEERRRAARTDDLPQVRHAVSPQGARDQYWYALCDVRHFCQFCAPHPVIGAQVGLVQDDDGRRAALPCERKIALESSQIEVAVQ